MNVAYAATALLNAPCLRFLYSIYAARTDGVSTRSLLLAAPAADGVSTRSLLRKRKNDTLQLDVDLNYLIIFKLNFEFNPLQPKNTEIFLIVRK